MQRPTVGPMMGVGPLSASQVLTAIEESGVTHVVGIPDNSSAPLFQRLRAQGTIRLVTVSREGEAFGVASGLWAGGGAPLVVIQNTGLLESGDALRGTCMRMGVPLPFLVTGRGYGKLKAAGIEPRNDVRRADLIRPDVDSVAIHTEPTLHAWSIPFTSASTAHDADRVVETIRRARAEDRPVALILTGGLASA